MGKTSLSELLRTKAASLEAETLKNKALIDDWVTAVNKLFDQMKSWLSSSDPSQVLQLEVTMADANEPSIGRYKIPRLEIRAFGKWVGVVPKARKTIRTARPPQAGAPERATGRVDITDELRRYVLYRFSNDGGDSWSIEDPALGSSAPLTQESFEEALASYFQ